MRPRSAPTTASWITTIVTCLLLAGGTVDSATAVPGGSGTQTATAPSQLVNAYPLGPQRLCCTSHSGSIDRTGATQAGSQPQPARSASRPPERAGSTGGGSSAVIWLVVGVIAALLFATGVNASFRRRRRVARAATDAAWLAPTGNRTDGAARPAGSQINGWSGHERFGSSDGERFDAAGEPTESSSSEADEPGEADAEFNLGVLLHERGEFEGALAAYKRAERAGDPDAAFNLGVLLYEAGDLEGAELAWRRSVRRGHTRAAANLGFLLRRRNPPDDEQSESAELAYRQADERGEAGAAFNLGVLLHERRDFDGAQAAYRRAEQRGDPDAAFNLGVLLYETGDLEGAQLAWRRGARRGHKRAAANLRYVLQLRSEREYAHADAQGTGEWSH